jgi:hypothetical protein
MNDQNINQYELDARQKVVNLAQAMLDGNVSFFEGAVQIVNLKNKINGIKVQDVDFDVFVLIVSETDHLPLKAQQKFWSTEDLFNLKDEFLKTEEWARSFALSACKNLIERFRIK